MKMFDFGKAYDMIEKNKNVILFASLGMDEDWEGSAETVFERGTFNVNLENESVRIAGVKGSVWATPTLHMRCENGSEESFSCYVEVSEEAESVMRYTKPDGFFDISECPNALSKKEHERIQKVQLYLAEQNKDKEYLMKHNPIQWEKLKETAAELQQVILTHWSFEKIS